jgi:hypothetical protein
MSKPYMDPVFALTHLADRAGARELEVAWTCPHVPNETDDHYCLDVTWTASVTYQGAQAQTRGHRTPNGAAIALAEQLLTCSMCRCRRPVALTDAVEGCRWRLVGEQWQPGCNAKPITVKGNRGDLVAMHAAAAQTDASTTKEPT